MEMNLFVFLIMLSFAAKQNKNVAESAGNYEEKAEEILVKIEADEYAKINKKETSSQYIGVSYNINKSKWRARRCSKHEKKDVGNRYYESEETAAHASDTLARKLIANGEQNHKLNFPNDDTEVSVEKKKETSSQYIGVSYNINTSKWRAGRCSRREKRMVSNGYYESEETAAHASDTLAKKLMANGEQNHKLNFPDNDTEVSVEEKKEISSHYIGVSYDVNNSKWRARRHSKHENKTVGNGSYESEETAAHASDTLARKLIANGEHNHKLNFPDDGTEVSVKERTKSSQYIGVSYNMNTSKWLAQRRSKHEKKDLGNGCYEIEETAAHASDTLARKLMENGEQNHKLNFPDDDIEVHPGRQRKRKRLDNEYVGHPKNN